MISPVLNVLCVVVVCLFVGCLVTFCRLSLSVVLLFPFLILIFSTSNSVVSHHHHNKYLYHDKTFYQNTHWVMRLDGIRNGMRLWMERTDFSTAFPAMLAASSSSIHSTNHSRRLDRISVIVETSGCVVFEPITAASTVHLIAPIVY